MKELVMADYMKNLGARMVEAGYHILPIAPGQKFPGQFDIGGWRPMFSWDRYGMRQPTDLELWHWQQWPGAGIGVVCGAVIMAIDIDLLDADDAFKARKMTEDHLGSTPAWRVGQAPKCLLVYRVMHQIASVSFGQFDILGFGRQFVAYGIHPRTGAPYSWLQEGLADLPLDALPVVTAEQVRGLCASLDEEFPSRQSAAPVFTPALAPRLCGAKPSAELRADHGAIKSALSHIPNPDVPYNEWVRVGMALKGALGETGADLFNGWSARSSKHASSATSIAWRSFRPDRIGAGTIFHLAKANGWRRVSGKTAPASHKFPKKVTSHG